MAPRIRPSRLVEDKARELTKDLKTRRARIAALYHFVTDRIRYVALEFGEHRYRPFSADWVLSHKMGDCKDKACLLVALCHSIGIHADMVLVRTADLGPVRSKLAVLGDFDHAIAYLPDDHLWLDGTATGYDPFRPPGLDQGAFVLVVRGPSSAPETTPVVGAGTSTTRVTLKAGAGNTLDVSVTVTATGDAAAALRSAFGGSHNRVRFARWLQRLFPGARLTGKPTASMSPGQDPATMELTGNVLRASIAGDGGVRIFPGRLTLLPTLAPTQVRHSPLLVPLRPDLRWTITVQLGRKPGQLPPPVARAGPFGTLDVTTSALPRGYRVSGRFQLTSGLLGARRVAAFRAFLLKAQRTFSQRLEAP
ncbi:MAG: transglutaminase domain-containing protein [Acidobacteria bacterium]|nr:transglutaminase domain-containing protein [Acidobacteriota bacterium]